MSNYLPSKSEEKRGVEKIPGLKADGGNLSTFKPIESSRLKFVGRPTFNPSPYLDPLSRRIYENPLKERDPITSQTPKPPHLRVHCSKQEKVKLFELLDASDRLLLAPPKLVTPAYGSGLFAVGKSLEKDRMILDSRGANILEAPPNRWIRALSAGELISRIHLQQDEDLLSSGSDLKDFYYFFRSTPARAYRNVLVGPMHPKELCHLRSFRPELLQSPTVYGCLNTLAMGDTQAVELAQACHIGIAAQHQIANEENLLSLQKPTPRTKDAVGIVIDDFVVLTKQKKDEEKPSSGAIRTSQMEEAYQKVGLMPNIDKGFRDEEKATYWGADVDGKLGTVRGSLKESYSSGRTDHRYGPSWFCYRRPFADFGRMPHFSFSLPEEISFTHGQHLREQQRTR